jgi:hypothetical protein
MEETNPKLGDQFKKNVRNQKLEVSNAKAIQWAQVLRVTTVRVSRDIRKTYLHFTIRADCYETFTASTIHPAA